MESSEAERLRAEIARLKRDYQTLVDHAPDVLARFDRAGRFLYVNETAERNTGIPAAAFLGRTFRELGGLPESNIAQWEEALALVVRTGEETRIEYDFPVPGRGVRHFECLLTPESGDDGTVETVATLTRDLTERYRTEIKLRESEARYRSLIDATSQIVWTNTAEGEMRGPNADWGAFTGQTEEEYQGYGWARAVHPEDAQPTIDAWQKSVAARAPFIFQHRLRRHDGVYRTFAIRAVPVLDDSGEIREWVGIHTDVSEAQATERARREGEALHRAILEAALDCIVTIDEQERVIEWNPAAERTFGFSRKQILGQFLSKFIIPERLRGAHARGISHYLATGEGPVLNIRIEVPALRADGTEILVELTAVPIQLEGRTLFTAYLRDLTAREQAASQQRAFLRDVLRSVTEGRLHLCHAPEELPAPLPPVSGEVTISPSEGIREIRHRAAEAAGERGFAQDRCADLATAVSEAAMNSAIHAGGGVGRVHANGDTVQIWIEDHGQGIDVSRLPRAALEKGYTTAGTLGHGMKMMLQTTDRLWLMTGVTGTTVVIEMDRTVPPLEWLREVSL